MKLAAGSRIGPYEILAPIGAGGMGEVYKARDAELGREIAVKVLPEHISTQTVALARLENEARLASSLNHPNIVTIYSIGWEGPRRYIAMEYIDGSTLQELIEAGPLPLEQALSITAQIAEGLAKAHEAGIIHRDLKPKNVMITRDGIAKILDFGLSKLTLALQDSQAPTPTHVDPADGLTKPGTILGTIEYMSPEQAAGRPLDFRSDQFSMGSLIYAVLTGKKPFHRETPVQTLSFIIEGEPRPANQLNPRVPQRLEAVIQRCIMKDPRKRYASTRELAHELRELQLSFQTPPRRLTRRDLIRISAGAGAALVAGGGVWMWLQRPYQPRPEALDWYRKGMAALHSMTFDTARKAFEQAVAADPEFALAHASLARAYDELDYSERAKESMLRALAAAQETRISGKDQKRLRAMQFTVSREYDRAVPLLRQLETEADDREKAAAALESGWLAQQREDTESAAGAYERALRIDPRYAAARLRLGFIQQRRLQDEHALNSFTEAERLYDAASDLEGMTETLYQRANLLNRRSRASEAVVSIEKALAIAQAVGNRYQQIRLQLLRATATRKLGQNARAAELAQAAIDAAVREKMDNLATSGMIALGNTFMVRGDFEKAEKSFLSALDVAQRGKVRRYEALASLSLGSLYEQKTRPEEAKRFIESAIPFYRQAGYRREFVQCHALLGGILDQLGEYDHGLKVLREVLPEAVRLGDPTTEIRIRERMCEILQDQGAWPEALKEAEGGANASGPAAESAYLRSICSGLYWRLGRSDEAEQSLAAVERLLQKSENPEALAVLRLQQTEIAYSKGRFESAAARARMAISAVPAAGDQWEPQAKLIEALALIRTGRRKQGVETALQLIQRLDGARLTGKAASARLSMAEALDGGQERELARKLALDALGFFERHEIWESVWRAHVIVARSSDKSSEVEAQNAFARSALDQLRKIWPADSVDGYLSRPDIKQLYSTIRS